MNENLVLLCYGVVLSRGKMYDVAIQNGTDDIYDAVYSHGLEFYVVGHADYAPMIAVGSFKVWHEDEMPIILDENGGKSYKAFDEVDLNVEDETKSRLESFGIHEVPQYMLFTSYAD